MTLKHIVHEAEKLAGCWVLALRSEEFGRDFRSGYEDAFKLIMDFSLKFQTNCQRIRFTFWIDTVQVIEELLELAKKRSEAEESRKEPKREAKGWT